MSCQRRILSLCVVFVAVAVASTLMTNSQSTNKPNVTKRSNSDEAAAPTIPFIPMVNLDRKDNNSNLDVHVPIVFDMSKNDGPDRSKLDLSVMSGMVTVNRDKSRQPNGNLQGPLKVTVFGIPVYSGMSTRRDHVDRISDFVTNTERKLLGESPISSPTQERQTSSSGSEKEKSEPGPMRDMLSSMKSANEKVIGTLSSLLSKMSKFLEHQAKVDGAKSVATTSSEQQSTSTTDSTSSKPKLSISSEPTATKEIMMTTIKPLIASSSSSDIASQVMTKVGHS